MNPEMNNFLNRLIVCVGDKPKSSVKYVVNTFMTTKAAFFYLECLVVGSLMTMASVTGPNFPKYSFRLSINENNQN